MPLLVDAHLLGPLDAPVAWQHRAWQRHRHALARRDVGRATDDLERLAAAERDRRQREPVRARVLFDGEQLADDDVLPVRAPALDALDLHPEQRQPLSELFRRELDVDVLAEPGQHRATRSVTLTDNGAVLLREARHLLEQADGVAAKLRARGRKETAAIRVGAIDSAAAGLLPMLLQDFRRRRPDVAR